MANFPTSLIDFQRRFPDEDALRHMSVRRTLADGFPVSWLWGREKLAARRQALHLRMRLLRQTDLRHGGDDPARLQTAADRLVLGVLSDVHAFQRNFRAATAKATRARLL